MLGCLLHGASKRRVEPGAVLISFAGLMVAAHGMPSVFAPGAVFARKLLLGL
jgi:hypothetical protein